jgi:hypothetical protein
MTRLDTYAVYGVYANYTEAPASIQSMLSTELPYTNLSLVLPYATDAAAASPEWMKMTSLTYQRAPQSGEVLAVGPLTTALSSGRSLYEVLAELGLPRSYAENYVSSLMSGQPLMVLYCGNPREAAVLESALQDSGAVMTTVNEETESYYADSDQNPHYYRESDLLKSYQNNATKASRRRARTSGGAA